MKKKRNKICDTCNSYDGNPYHRAPVDLPGCCKHPDHAAETREPNDHCKDWTEKRDASAR